MNPWPFGTLWVHGHHSAFDGRNSLESDLLSWDPLVLTFHSGQRLLAAWKIEPSCSKVFQRALRQVGTPG